MSFCTSLPICSFSAGDTVRFTISDRERPATTHTMALTLRNGTNILTATGEANGDDFDIVLTSAQTANLFPGHYAAAAVFTETATGDKKTVRYTGLQVLPNLTSEAVGPRRAAYNAARASVEGLAAKKYASTSINGQTYTLQTISGAWQALDRMQAAALEEDRILGLSTAGGLKRIVTRM